jgi:hypothetical protein
MLSFNQLNTNNSKLKIDGRFQLIHQNGSLPPLRFPVPRCLFVRSAPADRLATDKLLSRHHVGHCFHL